MNESRLKAVLSNCRTSTKRLMEILEEYSLSDEHIVRLIVHNNADDKIIIELLERYTLPAEDIKIILKQNYLTGEIVQHILCDYFANASIVERVLNYHAHYLSRYDVDEIVNALSKNSYDWEIEEWYDVHRALMSYIMNRRLAEYYYVDELSFFACSDCNDEDDEDDSYYSDEEYDDEDDGGYDYFDEDDEYGWDQDEYDEDVLCEQAYVDAMEK